jgi:hypothetical protein
MATRRSVILLWALTVVLFSAPARAESPTHAGEAAKRDGNDRNFALLRRDYETYVSYMHPALFKVLGSKEKIISTLERRRGRLEADGERMVASLVGEPIQLVKAGSELHAILPQEDITVVRGRKGEFHAVGYLLGVSNDDGKTWKFIDISRMGPKDVRQLLPNYNGKLKLPPRKAPTFVPK